MERIHQLSYSEFIQQLFSRTLSYEPLTARPPLQREYAGSFGSLHSTLIWVYMNRHLLAYISAEELLFQNPFFYECPGPNAWINHTHWVDLELARLEDVEDRHNHITFS